MIAQAINWIWWNSITGNSTAPTCAAGNSTPAIGTPDARLFFEPQNSSTIWSSRVKPSARPASQVRTRTIASNAMQAAAISARSAAETRCHSPSTTAAPKAV